jgi:hypothetical protein
MQFPWRFLIFTVLTSSFLFGVPFLFTYNKKIQLVLAGVVIVLLVITTKDYFRPNTYFESVTDSNYIAKDVIRWDTSKLAFEYVPKGIATKKDKYGNTAVAITKNDIAKSSYAVLSGAALVTVLEDKPSTKRFSVYAKDLVLFQINTYAFPGWKVFVDKKEVLYTDNNKLKLLNFPLQKGKHQITAVFTNTFYRTIGNSLSLVGLALIILYALSPSIFTIKQKRA